MFGRLEIFWSEGPAETFLLNKEVIAIGRSSGNDLVVDRNGISRYHAKLTAYDQYAELTDLESVNGVYVDGLRIQMSEPRILRGGEEIQFADVRMVYYPREIAGETIPSALEETTQTIQTPELSVRVMGPDMLVIPGSHCQAAIVIENLSDETRRYSIEVAGVSKDWVRLQRNEIELGKGDQTEILASFKPLRRSETRPGSYPITFTITPLNDSGKAISVDSTLAIGSYSGYGVLMGTSLIEGNQPFRLYLHNQGNDQLAVRLRGLDPNNSLEFTLDMTRLVLAAGERQSIYGRIRPKTGNVFGSPRRYRYDVISLAEDSSGFQAPVSGIYVSKPLLPPWAATLAIPLVAVIVIGIVAFLASLLKTEPIVPHIEGFSAVNEVVTLGEPVLLEWNVSQADQVNITYTQANQPPQDVPVVNPAEGSYQLQLQSSGVYTVTLTVENTGGTQTEIVVVRVLPDILDLQSEPASLIRNVQQDINLSWYVVGAEVADGNPLISLESPENEEVQARNLPEQGSQSFTIQPSDSLSITLRVIGHDGTENSRSLAFAIEEPRCVLANPTATIYRGPARNFSAFAVVNETGYTVNPLATNPDYTWLQIRYRASLAWVRVADFRCEGFTANQLSLADYIPPTPTPSSTPAATPTQTPTSRPTQTPTTQRPTQTPSLKPTIAPTQN